MRQSGIGETVVALIPRRKTDDRDLGLLSDLREAVAMARRYHPELAHRHVVDVGLRREGDRIRATFFFSGSKSK
ncbi:MAG: hypothetical protein GX162_11840 [Firmicutes bacterium]|jgi:hypothetical protein|nr:hypothetical protein [Bacillota bacterium]